MNVLSRIEAPRRMSIDQFFEWSARQAAKYELVEGHPKTQPWVKRGHSTIVGNIDFALKSQLDRVSYTVHQGDFAIATGPDTIRYADILVEKKSRSRNERIAHEAVMLVEVLSDSTMHIDFGPKKNEYFGLPTLATYVIVAQEFQQAWQWTRDDHGNWPPEPLIIKEGSVAVPALGAEISLDDVYQDLDVPKPD